MGRDSGEQQSRHPQTPQLSMFAAVRDGARIYSWTPPPEDKGFCVPQLLRPCHALRCEFVAQKNLKLTNQRHRGSRVMETAGESTRARHGWNVTCHYSCATWHLQPLFDECQLSQHVRAGSCSRVTSCSRRYRWPANHRRGTSDFCQGRRNGTTRSEENTN